MLKEIVITKFASIKRPIKLSLGRTSLILGANGTGKSAICDAISCLFEYQSAFSHRGRFSGDAILQGTLIREKRSEVKFEREIKIQGREILEDHLRLNGVETNDFTSLPSILRIIYLEQSLLQNIRNGRHLAKFLYFYLSGWSKGLSKHHFISLSSFTRLFNCEPDRLVEAIEWLPTGNIKVKHWDQEFWLNDYGSLSGGERCMLLIEIALALGHLFSFHQPTIILFDGMLSSLDQGGIRLIADRVNSIINPQLQFVFTTWNEEADSILCPDYTIKLNTGESGSYVGSIEKRTPRGVLHIEERIRSYTIGREDEFINSVIIPLIQKLGFSLVSRVQHHGPGELGIDIGPFIGGGFEWRKAFCGAQVKCAKLNAKSGNRDNINVLIDEVKKALNNKFYDMSNAVESMLDYVFIFLSQYPSKEAISTFNSVFTGDRRVIIIDPLRIAELIWEYGVAI